MGDRKYGLITEEDIQNIHVMSEYNFDNATESRSAAAGSGRWSSGSSRGSRRRSGSIKINGGKMSRQQQMHYKEITPAETVKRLKKILSDIHIETRSSGRRKAA